MSELKQSIAQLLIDNFKGATSKKASDMAMAIMAFVNADRQREIEAAFCGSPGTGECSCRKFADDPMKCDNRRTQPEATKPAQDLSAAILALPLPMPTILDTGVLTSWEAEVFARGALAMRKAAAALASPADALVAGDRVDAEVERLQAEIMRMTAAHAIELHRLKKQAVSLCERIETGASIDNDKRPSDYKQGIIKGAKDCAYAINAAIQAQKDGHG